MTMPASDTHRSTEPVPEGRTRRAAAASFRLVILLLIQYVLGVADNLYGTAPTAAKKLTFFSGPLIAAHVIVGTLLIVAASYVLVASIRAGARLAVVASAIGLLALLVAWATGSAFAQDGTSGFSMAMGTATAVALLCYVVNVRSFSAR